MNPALRDLIPPWLIDDPSSAAPSEQQAAVLGDAFAAVAYAASPVAPSAALRARVIEGALRPRLALADRVARLIDVSVERARELLLLLDDPRLFEGSSVPGIGFYDLPAGPSLAGAVVGFVKVKAGFGFPPHTHLGDEVALVLQGALQVDDGRIYEVGDFVRAPAESTHSLLALPGDDLLWVSVSDQGIDFAPVGGPVMYPKSSRS